MSKASQEKQRQYEAVHGIQNRHNRPVEIPPPTQEELDRQADLRDARRGYQSGGMSIVEMLPILFAMSSVGSSPRSKPYKRMF